MEGPRTGALRTGALRGVQGGSVQLAEEGLRVKGHRGADTAERQRLHAHTHVPVRNQRCKGTTWASPSASKQQTFSFQKSQTRPTEAAAPAISKPTPSLTSLAHRRARRGARGGNLGIRLRTGLHPYRFFPPSAKTKQLRGGRSG